MPATEEPPTGISLPKHAIAVRPGDWIVMDTHRVVRVLWAETVDRYKDSRTEPHTTVRIKLAGGGMYISKPDEIFLCRQHDRTRQDPS